MKKRILSVLAVCAVAMGMLCGCMSVAPEPEAPESVTPDTPVTGTWTSPAGSTLDFNEDGSYVDHTKSNRTGTFAYVAENSDFSLAQLFDKVEYVICTADNGDEAITAAVMQDVIIAYSAKDHEELYFLRDGRDAVDAEAILGEWIDVYDAESTMNFSADGKLNAFDETSDYTVEQGDYGTCITVRNAESETSYAIASYEDYLFMICCDSQKLYLLARESAADQ